MRRFSALATIATLTGVALTALATPATAAPNGPKPPSPGDTVTLAEHLVGPLTFAVTPSGTLYIGQDFAGLLTKSLRRGFRGARDRPWDRRRLDPRRRRDVGRARGDMEQVLASRLMQRAADGTVTSIDVLAWEAG